jgi:hypothetical protein
MNYHVKVTIQGDSRAEAAEQISQQIGLDFTELAKPE